MDSRLRGNDGGLINVSNNYRPTKYPDEPYSSSHLKTVNLERCGGTLVEFRTRPYADFGDAARIQVLLIGDIHCTKRKIPAAADAPKAVEAEYLAIRIHAENAAWICHQGSDLRRFI